MNVTLDFIKCHVIKKNDENKIFYKIKYFY